MDTKINIVNATKDLEDRISTYISNEKSNRWSYSTTKVKLPPVSIDMSDFLITTKTVSEKDFIVYKNYNDYCNKNYQSNSIEDKLKRKNLDNIKTFSFILGTRFDREYFKRIYPDIKRTTKHKNADIVIYDDKSIKNLSFSKKYYQFVTYKNQDVDTYCSNFSISRNYLNVSFKDKQTKDFCLHFLDCNYYGHCVDNYGASIMVRNDQSDLIGKMCHIDELISKRSIKNEMVNLTAAEAETLLAQIKSSFANAKTALETCLQYSNKYYLVKMLLFYTAHCVHGKIPYSGKLEYFKKHFSRLFVSSYCKKHWDIFNHISHLCVSAERQLKPNMETQVFKNLIQTNTFITCYSDVKFKINIQMELPFTEIVDSNTEDVEINEFIV